MTRSGGPGAASSSKLVLVAQERIAHHYAMLIQGSNRRRFRIPGNFTAEAEIRGA